MKLELEQLNAQGTPSKAVTSHKGQALSWNVQLFEKTSFNNDFDIFEQINGYWASLPMSEQDKIFETYRKISDAFGLWDTTELTMALYALVKELLDHHPINEMAHWLLFHGKLFMPAGVKESFQESNENSSTRERTYVAKDYHGLVALSVTLRAMIPVWGEFINRTKRETGTAFKEYYAFQLLSQSKMFHSDPMERLRVYVEKSLPADKSTAPAILRGGLSTEDFPVWMLGLVLVRRLSVGDVRGIDPTSSLVTFIYKYIDQKAKGHDSAFNGQVKDKLVEGSGQEGENNLSKLEGYKIKLEIPAGDIVLISHYVEDIYNVALRICPDIDPELVRLSEQSTLLIADHQIWQPQMTIMQWVLKPVIPPRGLLYLNKMLALKAMAAAQALLWHRGHFEIAALMSAVEHDAGDAQQLMGPDARAKIPKELMEELDKLYPYSRKPPGKGKPSAKRANPASDAIDLVAASFNEHAWRLTLPSEWVAQVTGNKNNRRYGVPHDIKVKLANLSIAIAKRSF